jgi:uncharacterized protein DUF3800
MPPQRRPSQTLPIDHPTAVAFLDESGSISQDRFFSVGCLKLSEPSVLLRRIQKLRDRHHWYHEIHFFDLTKDALPFYERVVEIVAASGGQFSCFVADREGADPVARFGSPWKAYEKLAAQLLLGSIKRREIVTVLADNYSTPDSVVFEQDVRVEVNKRLRRLAVASVCRLDSAAADPLQVVDLLTSAVAFEFRQSSGIAGRETPKARLARKLRNEFGVKTFLKGHEGNGINVKLYGSQLKPRQRRAKPRAAGPR